VPSILCKLRLVSSPEHGQIIVVILAPTSIVEQTIACRMAHQWMTYSNHCVSNAHGLSS